MTNAILFIHGMWGGAWYWEDYIRFFEEKGYKCIAPFLRHHDTHPATQPPKELGSTSLLDYASDLQEEIEKLNENPIIIGHSMGGLLAQILAARGLAKAVVLVTPASPAGINALKWSVLKSFAGPILQLKFLGFPFKISFKAAVYSMLHLLPVEEQERIYNRFVFESGRAAMEIGFWPFDFKHAARVNESKVTCPMLVVSGSEDRITPSKVVKQVAEKYRHGRQYQEFEGHAHWIIAEKGWEKVAEYIADWLEKNLDDEWLT